MARRVRPPAKPPNTAPTEGPPDPAPEEEAQDLVNGAECPASSAHARLIAAIAEFEAGLDDTQEVALGLAGGTAGVLQIDALGWIEPDILTFDGIDAEGIRTRMIQHVTQLNVLLVALPREDEAGAPRRIGFRLAAARDQG